ncbi:hypothetical protein [Catenulispora rubra]|uniref:hypothetical protein n=1 Tax=Catenulispora rubra TaxID=280293 RepID=UPI0018926411|nr:hypothetical protein [Catenulispora rubra]
MLNHTPAATSVQLANAAEIGRALRHHDWTPQEEPQGKHPGAHRATVWTPRESRELRLLVLTIDNRRGQIAELLRSRAAFSLPDRSGRRRSGRRPSWRLTGYNAPPLAVTAAALAGVDDAPDSERLDEAGWDLTRHVAPDHRHPALAEFTRRDKAVSAVFRFPNFNPPCERCRPESDLGDAGGWLISGPGFSADATAHAPATVITAFALNLPGSSLAASPPASGQSATEQKG